MTTRVLLRLALVTACAVGTVSPLCAGFTEIILRENTNGRRIACTVTDAGDIENWVELN